MCMWVCMAWCTCGVSFLFPPILHVGSGNQNFVDLCGKHLYLLGHLTAWKHVLSYKFPKEQGSSI